MSDFSQANAKACAEVRIAPLIALGRERHHLSWKQRFAQAPSAPGNPTALEAMAHLLTTPEGQQAYALRKQTTEPVFGIIKSVMVLRQFQLRSLNKAKEEWNLVTLAWNMKRFIEGIDCNQAILFSEPLKDYVGDDNPVCAIDVFVDAELRRCAGSHGSTVAITRR